MDRDLRIRMVLEALDKVTRPLKDIGTGASRTAKQLRATRDRLKEIERAQADVGGFRELKNGLRTTDAELGTARERVRALARQIAATDAPTKKLTAEFAKAKREAAALGERHEHEAAQLQRLRDRLSAAGVSTRALASEERRLRAEAARTTETIGRQEARLATLRNRSERLKAGRERFGKTQEAVGNAAAAGAAGIGTGIALGAPIVAVTKDAMALEDVMADVRKVVNFDTPRQFEQMREDVIALSQRLPMTAEGIGQIVAAAGRSGIARRDLLPFAEDAAKMAVAFDMSAEDAGTMMATWRTAFNTGRAGTRVLGDQVNALTNKFGGNVTAVNAMVTRIGPLGKVAGTASGQIAGLAQMMAKLGLEEEVGATGIKNMLLSLSRGAATTPHAAAAFKQLGLDAKQVARDMQRDAGGTILDVFTRLSKLDKADTPGVLTRLFGRESIAAIAPLLTNLDQLRANFALVGDQSKYAGSMEAEYQARAKTTSNAVLLANNNFTALRITVGTLLLPTVVALAQSAGRLLNRFRDFAAAHPVLTKGLVLIGGGIALLVLGFGALSFAVAGLLAPFAGLAFVAGALNIALLPLLGIIAGVVAAVALLAAGAYLVIANWSSIAAFFGRMWDGIRVFFTSGLGWLAGVIARFRAFGSNIVQGIVDGITGRLSALKSTVVGAATAAAGWFKAKLGIHSPSRVFHQFGGFMMEGLHNGIAAGAGAPLRRVDRLSRDLTAALAVGAAAPAIAAGGVPGAASGGTARAAPAALGPVSIVIHQAPGQSATDLAQAVRAELEKLRRQDAAAARSSYLDDPDHGGFV